MDEQAAAQFVVTHGNLGSLLTKRSNAAHDWKIVYNWRQRVLGPPDPARLAEREGFNGMLKLLIEQERDHPGLDVEARAASLLRGMARARGEKPA
jgi:hypothetical protein